MIALGFKVDKDVICSSCFEKLIKALDTTVLQIVAENDLCPKCGFSYGRDAARKAAKNIIEGRTKWK